MSESDDDDEPLVLGQDALLALQSVLGGNDGGLDLDALLKSRQLCNHDSSSDDDDDDDHNHHDDDNDDDEDDPDKLRPGESYADYYKRLYPERYMNENENEEKIQALKDIENPVAIISVEDDYVQNLILKCFEKRPKWRVVTQIPMDETNSEIYHFHWGEYEHIEWFSKRFTAEEIVVSCYYNRKGLIRKGLLAEILNKWHAKYKTTREPVAPKSYVLKLPNATVGLQKDETGLLFDPNDIDQKFLASIEQCMHQSGFPGFEVDSNIQTWIFKPSVTNQAKGMCLIQSKTDLLKAMYEADPVQKAGDFVLQEYIAPLLLDERKFHLRVFMVLHGNLTAYVFPEFLAIFSLIPYAGASLENTPAHFTNIAHQQVLSLEDQHRCMRLFEETKQDMIDAGLVRNLEEAGHRIEKVKKRVYDIIAETVEAVSSELTFTSKKNCFEIFGLDFMIDPDWCVWLLEANAEPDLSKAGDRLQPVIDQLLMETIELVVENDARCSSEDDSNNNLSFVKVYDRKGRSF